MGTALLVLRLILDVVMDVPRIVTGAPADAADPSPADQGDGPGGDVA
jgi:hypothetical protein